MSQRIVVFNLPIKNHDLGSRLQPTFLIQWGIVVHRILQNKVDRQASTAIIGGARGRVAGVAPPPPPFGRKILPKKGHFG